MIKSIPNGVYPTMVTPYTADNKVDYNAVEQIINWYVERGVDGIFAICQSSEIFFLSFEERYELLKFIIEHTPKNISIVASGHTADDIPTQLDEAKRFIDLGIDGYVFISNRLAKQDESDDVFLKNVDIFMNEIQDTAFGVYECPYPYKRLMTPETLGKLARTGRFTFLKDTCCNPEQIKAKLDAVEGTGLKIYNANSATLLDTLKITLVRIANRCHQHHIGALATNTATNFNPIEGIDRADTTLNIEILWRRTIRVLRLARE